ncbi:MAG: winged helix-turn-helix transcriptional regulator [Gammaproteobacteria bacterium]|nr:winged helix-turn-helix transcriptional regulator [Gammaproteobacteria bacterium]MCP5199551.1 winged helix-turn-helix transcriptional regulator [Gammaproteobacteria bacterium]
MAEALLDLVALEKTLRYARRTLGPDVTVQRLLVLVAVYGNEGASQSELLGTLGDISITALSRNLADLSALTSRKTPGPGLIELRVDPLNLRRKQVYLTARGRRFFARWPRATAAA